MTPEQIAAILGSGLIVVAAARSAWRRAAIRRQLREALSDPVPAARVAAVQTAGENGVARNARMLLVVAAEEEDIWVRQVLAQTVVRHRWEPAVSEALVELRIWAKQELMWGQLASTVDDGPVQTLSAEATASLGWWDAS